MTSAETGTLRAVLFDFDGTLADTAPDLGYVLNLQRQSRGLSVMPIAELRPFVSQGARGLLRAGFDITPGHADYEAMRMEFMNLYEQHLARETQLFPGMAQVLDEIEQRGLAWGVVTNKIERFTWPVMRALQLETRAGCVVGGDTCARAKPHPDPLLEAARRLDVEPRQCLYVGDDERDVQAGLAAGMRPVAALYGYLGNGKRPQDWGADDFIEQPLDLLKLLAVTAPVR